MSERSGTSPLVSVIILAYQQPAYLNAALESVLRQTYPASSIEIIVLDDASAAEYTNAYRLPPNARLIVSAERRALAAAARNAALREARGRYAAFLDQDDLWLPEKLAVQVEAMESHPDVWLHCTHYERVDAELRPLKKQYSQILRERDPLPSLLRRNTLVYSTAMMRRSALGEIGAFNEAIRGTADWEMWLRVVSAGRALGDARPLVQYRVHDSQWSRSQLTIAQGASTMFNQAAEWLVARRPDLWRLIRRRQAHWMRELGRARLEAGDPMPHEETMRVLRASARIWPLDLQVYRLMWRARRAAGKSATAISVTR